MSVRPRLRPHLFASILLLVLGCGTPEAPPPAPLKPVVEAGRTVSLRPGSVFRFVDHFSGSDAARKLPRTSDGTARMTLNDARMPVLPVPTPYVIKQTLRLPSGGTLRTAFGLARESWNKRGGGARFTVRLRRDGETSTILSEQVTRWVSEDDRHWLPVNLDIPSSEGEVEIELSTELVGAPPDASHEDVTGSYAVWVNPIVFAHAEKPLPNILVVVIDALRADHLGCYGYPPPTSPFLDSFAAQSLLFEDANSQATWTLPSIWSLLSSSYPLVYGARVPKISQPGRPEPSFTLQPVAMPVSLQSSLQSTGYETMASVAGGFLNASLGFDADFDWYWCPDVSRPLPQQLTILRDRLASRPPAPFFAVLHTMEVHDYFKAESHCLEYFDRGYLGPLTDPARLRDAYGGRRDGFSSEGYQYLVDLYDGAIRHNDRYLGLFLRWLFNQPWGDNTVVVVTADHGEGFGDHDVMGHGGAPYCEVVHVPLLLRLPESRFGGRRVGAPVALIDIMPTLLELAEAPVPAGLSGRSLLPLATGAEGDSPPIFSESWGGAVMARDEDWWYVTHPGKLEELFNIARDRDQTRSMARSHPRQLDHMRQVLADLVAEGARGYRLVVTGARSEPISIQLRSDRPLPYLSVPTLRQHDVFSVQRETVSGRSGPGGDGRPPTASQLAEITLAPGEAPHVILFDRCDAKHTVSITARVGSGPSSPSLFRLGETGQAPDTLPLVVGPALDPVLACQAPPAITAPDQPEIWLWIPESARRVGTPYALDPEDLPEALKSNLRTLGYLR